MADMENFYDDLIIITLTELSLYEILRSNNIYLKTYPVWKL